MKSLAGANPDAKPDYRSQALTELNKLEQKVILLHEMLDNVDNESGEKFAKGDVYDVKSTTFLVSHRRLIVLSSKLQRSYSTRGPRFRNGSQMLNPTIRSHLVAPFSHYVNISDTLTLDTYLQTNDQMNNVLARYEAYKRGETPPASIPAELLPNKSDSLSLIDFDDAPPQAGSSSGAGSGSTPADDLASLFDSSVSFTSPPVSAPSHGIGMPSLVSNNTKQQASAISPQFTSGASVPPSRPQFGQIKLPSTPPLQNQSQGPGRVGSPGVSSTLGAVRTPPSSNLTATSTLQRPSAPQATPSPPTPRVSTPQGKDPFADLVGLF
jgi:ADP-ribosylation factor-binding protein GGA